jgi:hypothetical protein
VGRWREENGLGRNQGQTKRDSVVGEAAKVKVAAGCSGKDGSVREGEWHGWECEWAHEVGEGREDRLPKENMIAWRRLARMGEGNRTNEGRGGGVLVRFVARRRNRQIPTRRVDLGGKNVRLGWDE